MMAFFLSVELEKRACIEGSSVLYKLSDEVKTIELIFTMQS